MTAGPGRHRRWRGPYYAPHAGLCERCGEPAEGLAYIGSKRYCHGWGTPSCYELELFDQSWLSSYLKDDDGINPTM